MELLIQTNKRESTCVEAGAKRSSRNTVQAKHHIVCVCVCVCVERETTSIQYYEPMNFKMSRETTNERGGMQFSLVASSEITLAQTKNTFTKLTS